MDKGHENKPLLENQSEDQEHDEQLRIYKSQKRSRKWALALIIVFVVVVVAAIFTLAFFPWHSLHRDNNVGRYKKAAVTSDAKDCSTIGKQMLERGGSSVDSAIATSLCIGLYSVQSSGVGGGSFMLIYERPRNGSVKELAALDFREMAPQAATPEMYNHSESYGSGGLSIGVPGEIAGYWEAWKRYGRLPWKELFQPTIDLCKNGYVIGKFLASQIMVKTKSKIPDSCKPNATIRSLLYKADGSVYAQGDISRNPRLADTLQKISESEGSQFYTGQVSLDVLQDLTDMGSPITADDLKTYKPIWREPVNFDIRGMRLSSLPAPSGGPIVNLILNILEGYPQLQHAEDPVLIYHRIVESFKFGYALKTRLGDPDFVDIKEAISNATSKQYAAYIRSRLDDRMTHDIPYYNPAGAVQEEHGTSHIGVMAPDGAAVALTSTINSEFGSKCLGPRSGILFNNEMDDFSNPANPDEFHSANVIAGGKRPLSSMAPVFVFDDEGDVNVITGGSGGSQITTAVAYVLWHHLILNLPIEKAVERARLHHRLEPNTLEYETQVPQNIVEGLREKGHDMEEKSSIAVTNSIQVTCHGREESAKCITAVSDNRKGGQPDGY